MSITEEFEQKLDGSCILLDTSVVTPREDPPLPQILYQGMEGLEALNPSVLTRRTSRLVELTQLVQTHSVIAIPQVCSEIERHLKILNGQHTFLMSEIKESMQGDLISELRESMQGDLESDVQYYTNILDIIKGYNFSLHQFLKQIKKTQAPFFAQESEGYYKQFLDMARQFSKDLVVKSSRAKENMRHRAYVGLELETDQHLAATLFVLAYEQPVALLTRDNGLDELTRRLYEFVTKRAAPESGNSSHRGIPTYTINVCNTNEYEQRELVRYQQKARKFLSDVV